MADKRLQELIDRIFEIIPSYYDEREALEIEIEIKKYILDCGIIKDREAEPTKDNPEG